MTQQGNDLATDNEDMERLAFFSRVGRLLNILGVLSVFDYSQGRLP